jgi:hypothetical protein
LAAGGKLLEADIAHIAKEIEDMGKNLKRELVSRLEILFIHLPKWQYQPGHHGNSWRYTIDEQRAKLADYLKDNLSLKPQLPEAVERGYRYAVRGAPRKPDCQKTLFWNPVCGLTSKPSTKISGPSENKEGLGD